MLRLHGEVLKAMLEGNAGACQKTTQKRVDSAVPMERMGARREIADGVLYLAGRGSSLVTGSALLVDGGYTWRSTSMMR